MTIGAGEDEVVIGGASYFVVDSDAAERSAELAFTVEEDFQGRGVATLLMRRIIAIARAGDGFRIVSHSQHFSLRQLCQRVRYHDPVLTG